MDLLLGAGHYWTELPKWIAIIPFILGVLPTILSFLDNKKEKENIAVLKLLKENQTMRQDLSKKEKKILSERMKNKEWDIAINSLKNR